MNKNIKSVKFALAPLATLLMFGCNVENGSETVLGIQDPITETTTPVVTTPTVTDDFESYTAGTLISDASQSWLTANIKDNSDSLGTTTAEVSTTQSNGGVNSLYLADAHSGSKPFAYREFSAASTSGSVSIDVFTPSTNTKVTYINIGVGKNNSDRYFELRINGDDLEYEAGSSDVDLAENGFTQDAWHTINIAWTSAGMVTVSLDGTAYSAIDQSTTGLTSTNIPTQFTIYTGDNSGKVNTAYFDNLDSDLF